MHRIRGHFPLPPRSITHVRGCTSLSRLHWTATMQACRVAHLSKFTMCNSSRPRKNQSTALLIGVILVIFAAVFHTNSSDVVGAICFISFIVTLVAFFIGVTYAVGRISPLRNIILFIAFGDSRISPNLRKSQCDLPPLHFCTHKVPKTLADAQMVAHKAKIAR